MQVESGEPEDGGVAHTATLTEAESERLKEALDRMVSR